MRIWPGILPWRTGEAGSQSRSHQFVPGGMKANLIDALAESIVGAKLRRVFVCIEAERERFGAARQLAQGDKFVRDVGRGFSQHRLRQRAIGAEDVVIFEGGGLIIAHRR
jgi:hypothetical protein